MRKARVIENCRCYHLISRLAHRAFFLDDEEKTRAVELLRRVEEFSGVIVLAYAIMSNHFHIFIYVPETEEIDINAWEAGIVAHPEDYAWCSFAAAVKGDAKARRGYAFMYGNADDWDVIRDCHEKSMRRGDSPWSSRAAIRRLSNGSSLSWPTGR